MTNIDDISSQQGSSDNFTGTTYNLTSCNGGRISYSCPGNFWHKHGGEQVRYFLEGKRRVFIDGQGLINAKPGDIVKITPILSFG